MRREAPQWGVRFECDDLISKLKPNQTQNKRTIPMISRHIVELRFGFLLIPSRSGIRVDWSRDVRSRFNELQIKSDQSHYKWSLLFNYCRTYHMVLHVNPSEWVEPLHLNCTRTLCDKFLFCSEKKLNAIFMWRVVWLRVCAHQLEIETITSREWRDPKSIGRIFFRAWTFKMGVEKENPGATRADTHTLHSIWILVQPKNRKQKTKWM